MCDEEHCDCNHGIFKSSIKHTFNTLLFVVIISFIVNVLFEYLGANLISKIFMKDNKHDMEIQVGKFRFSIKKHDKE